MALQFFMGFALTGCAANPLVGRWVSTNSSGGAELSTTLALNVDGTVSTTIVGSGMCTGTMTIGGQTWSSDARMLIFSGRVMCSGSVMCTIAGTPVHIDCGSSPSSAPREGACAYRLSASNNSLTLDACTGTTGGSTTYARRTN